MNGKPYSDFPENLNPSIITGDKFRPDLLFILPSNHLYTLELTIGYESNLSSNLLRKKAKYKELISELQNRYDKVYFVNLSMGALGTMGSSSSSFLDMLKELDFDEGARSFIVKSLLICQFVQHIIPFVLGIRHGQTLNC